MKIIIKDYDTCGHVEDIDHELMKDILECEISEQNTMLEKAQLAVDEGRCDAHLIGSLIADMIIQAFGISQNVSATEWTLEEMLEGLDDENI